VVLPNRSKSTSKTHKKSNQRTRKRKHQTQRIFWNRRTIMTYYNIKMCDFCGKRTSELEGRLILSKKAMTKWRDTNQMYQRQVTVRSWSLCKNCLRKISDMESLGDKIKEEIELKLDEIRIKQNPLKLLNSMKGEE
jgi:hypothetical protein